MNRRRFIIRSVIAFIGLSSLVSASSVYVGGMGIVVNGDGNTLQSVYTDISNASIFSYNTTGKEAISTVNIFINESAELTINNETLRLNCSYDGEYWLRTNYNGSHVMNGNSTLEILNSSYITVVNSDYQFGFTVYSGTGFVMKDSRLDNCGWNMSDYRRGLRIEANNITIENSSITTPKIEYVVGLYLHNVSKAKIVNSTINAYLPTNIVSGPAIYMVNSSDIVLLNT